MQYDLKELEKQYGGKTDEQNVETMKELFAQMNKRGEQLVGLLWYYEKTKRYQNISGYKGVAFKVFVWEHTHIPYHRYRELAYAYNWYPQEARDLGPQTIQAIRERVGTTKIPKVLGEIKATVEKIKDPEKKRAAMYKVIDKHAPKREKKVLPNGGPDTKAYWKQKYDELWKKYKAIERENEELRGRLAKQEMPVKAFLAMKEAAQTQLQA